MATPSQTGAAQTQRPSSASYQTLFHWTDFPAPAAPTPTQVKRAWQREENFVLCFTLFCLEKYTRVFFSFFLGKKLKEMYREQNYIFSFTFVYKSKTACLIKHL